MFKPVAFLFVSFCAFFLLYLFCSSPANPFEQDTTALNITLKNSKGIDTAATTFTDTIGDPVHVGISAYLSNNIDSVTLAVFTQAEKADTSFTLKGFGSDLDTIWRAVAFSSTGIRIIKTTLFINNGSTKKYENSVSVVSRSLKWLHDSISIETSEGCLFQLNLADSIINANDNPVTISLLTSSLSGDSIVGKTWKYPAGYSDSGSHIVKICADDGLTKDTLTILVHVTNVNRPPEPISQTVLTGRNTAKSILLTATDPDGDAIASWSVDKLPVNGSIVTSPVYPNITYTPSAGFIGRDSLLFRAHDGKVWSTVYGTIIINVDSAKVAPVIITDIRLDTTVNQGSTTTFSVVINNCFPAPVFAWFKKDSLKSIAGTQILTLTNVTIKDTGNYYVIISNNAGADTSKFGHLVVNVPPVIITQPSSLLICIGEADSFVVAASGTQPLTYLWKKGTATVGTNQNVYRIVAVSKTDTGTYTCVVTNSVGSVTSNGAALSLNLYTVKFNSNGGSLVDSQKVYCNTNAVAPIAPIKQSYTFAGWYTDSVLLKNSFNFTSVITGNITVFAKWEIRDVDGNVYSEVKIGNQVWMKENLRTTKYNDGTAIPIDTDYSTWTNLTSPAYCYYNNTTNTDSIRKFGALYNWYTVNSGKLAPQGWHVPSDSEWDTLQTYLIANGYNYDGSTTGNLIAKSMAAQTDWEIYSDLGTIGNDLTKNNSSGFSALPSGYLLSSVFQNIGSSGDWWSTGSNVRDLANNHTSLNKYAVPNASGFSVRLVKNN